LSAEEDYHLGPFHLGALLLSLDTHLPTSEQSQLKGSSPEVAQVENLSVVSIKSCAAKPYDKPRSSPLEGEETRNG
jgi:hypothetical protein